MNRHDIFTLMSCKNVAIIISNILKNEKEMLFDGDMQ